MFTCCYCSWFVCIPPDPCFRAVGWQKAKVASLIARDLSRKSQRVLLCVVVDEVVDAVDILQRQAPGLVALVNNFPMSSGNTPHT